MNDKNSGADGAGEFDELGADWWNPNGALKTLHDINPLRHDYVANHVELKDKKVLDLGCGGGLLSESMAAAGAVVSGVDISRKLIRIAADHAEEKGLEIEYVRATPENFARDRAHTFDAVTCMELIEHVDDPSALIQACAKLLKPRGCLFLSTINRNLKSYLYTKIIAEYLLRLLPPGTHDYARYCRPSELARWCRNSGLRVTDISGFAYLPVLRRCHWTRRSDVNYLLCARVDDAPPPAPDQAI